MIDNFIWIWKFRKKGKPEGEEDLLCYYVLGFTRQLIGRFMELDSGLLFHLNGMTELEIQYVSVSVSVKRRFSSN